MVVFGEHEKLLHIVFYRQNIFSTQGHCCSTFQWIEPHSLLKCCLLHVNMILLRHYIFCITSRSIDYIIYFLLSFFFFITSDHIISLKQTHAFADIVFKCSYSSCALAFAYFFVNFSLILLITVLFIKEHVLK